MNARIPQHAKFDPDRWMIATASQDLKHFMGARQLRTMRDLARGEEGPWFITRMVELAALINAMPKTGETDGQGGKAIAHLHYFIGGCDWYITEKDMGDGTDDLAQHQAFGTANLGHGAEMGYISIKEITDCGAELDLHFTPVAIGTIPAARCAHFEEQPA